MKISEINNRKIKIHKTSITVYNDEFKTAGVVRGAETMKQMNSHASMRDLFDASAALKKLGIKGVKFNMDRMFFVDKKFYYIAHPGEENIDPCTKKFYDDPEIVNQLKAAGVNILRCSVYC